MNKRIMIVDDEDIVRFSVSHLLSASGFEAVSASNGDECIRFLEDGFTGIVLMDVMMPVENGWKVIRRIIDGGYHRQVVIIMLTALESPDDGMLAVQEYVVDYIPKPFQPAVLISTVEKYLKYAEVIKAVKQERGG